MKLTGTGGDRDFKTGLARMWTLQKKSADEMNDAKGVNAK